MKIDREFWENLDISVDDVIDLEKTGKRLVVRLSNKLKHSPGWLEILNEILKKKYDSLKELLQHLYVFRKGEFYKIYFLAEFAELVDRNSIKNRLPEEIKKKYENDINNMKINYDALLPLIFKLNKDIVTNIWYDHLINRSRLKPYRSTNKIDVKEFFDKLERKIVEEFFVDLKNDNTIRRTPKVWWFEKRDEKIKIFVRLETARRRSIHQVTRNTFLKTAGDRILIIHDKGNRLDVLAKESDTVAKWAGILVSKGTGKKISYEYINQEIESTNIKNFIDKVRNNEISGIKLLGFERKNAPVANSPTIKLESKDAESIGDSIKELDKEHGLQLISDIQDIPNITVGIKGKLYKLSLVTSNGMTTILFDNRNLSEDEKDTVRQLLHNTIREK